MMIPRQFAGVRFVDRKLAQARTAESILSTMAVAYTPGTLSRGTCSLKRNYQQSD